MFTFDNSLNGDSLITLLISVALFLQCLISPKNCVGRELVYGWKTSRQQWPLDFGSFCREVLGTAQIASVRKCPNQI